MDADHGIDSFFDVASPSAEYTPRSQSNSLISIADSDQRSSTVEASPEQNLTPSLISRSLCGLAQKVASQLPQPCSVNPQPCIEPAVVQISRSALPLGTAATAISEHVSHSLSKEKERQYAASHVKGSNAECYQGMREHQEQFNTPPGPLRSPQSQRCLPRHQQPQRPEVLQSELQDYQMQLMLLESQNISKNTCETSRVGHPGPPSIESDAEGSDFNNGTDSSMHSGATGSKDLDPSFPPRILRVQQRNPETLGSSSTVSKKVENNPTINAPTTIFVQPNDSVSHNEFQTPKTQIQGPLLGGLSHFDFGLHMIDAQNRKSKMEARLEDMKIRGIQNLNNEQLGRQESVQTDLTLATLGQRFIRTQELFAIAHSQLQHELGMNLTEGEKDLAQLGPDPKSLNEEEICDSIFIESVKLDLLTMQVSRSKCQQTKEAQQLLKNASRSAETDQKKQRNGQRQNQIEEPVALPHKPPCLPAPPPEQGRRQPPISHKAVTCGLNSGSPLSPFTRLPHSIVPREPRSPPRTCGPGPGHKPSYRTQMTVPPPPPHPPVGTLNDSVPGPPRPASSPSLPDHSRGPPPPPRHPENSYAPRPPPRNHFNSRPPPPPPPCFPPGTRPSGPPPGLRPPGPPPIIIDRSKCSSLNPPLPSHALPTGISVNTFTTAEGQTSSTMTMDPKFDLRNAVEIVTRTVRARGKVETITTTSLIPLIPRTYEKKGLWVVQKRLPKAMESGSGDSDTDSDSDSDSYSGSDTD